MEDYSLESAYDGNRPVAAKTTTIQIRGRPATWVNRFVRARFRVESVQSPSPIPDCTAGELQLHASERDFPGPRLQVRGCRVFQSEKQFSQSKYLRWD